MQITDEKITIHTPALFSFEECLHFLDRGYDDCLYSIGSNFVIKPLEVNGAKLLVDVRGADNALEVEVLHGKLNPETLQQVGQWVANWFDLDRDLAPFYSLLNKHEQLAFMPEAFHGLRLMGIPDLFEALCWCVIGQQINLTFAHRLKRILVETYGTFIMYQGRRHYYFPQPRVLAGLEVEQLKALQFSRQKAEYIIGIASELANGTLSKEQLEGLPDSKQKLQRLLQIRGVGQWTANYVLMKSLRQPSCITYGDTGLRSAVSDLLGLNQKPTHEEIEAFFEPFPGWESYLNIYLWRTLS